MFDRKYNKNRPRSNKSNYSILSSNVIEARKLNPNNYRKSLVEKNLSRYSRTNNNPSKLIKSNESNLVKVNEMKVCSENLTKQMIIDSDEIFVRGYKILKKLGSGLCAQVYKARDFMNRRNVALKVTEKNAMRKNFKSFMKNEIEVVRRLNHPNIISMFRAFNTTLTYVLVMELAEKGSFSDILIENGPMPEAVAKNLFKKIGFGIDYMHENSIAHLDIKLENLLMTKTNEPKICDFSLSLVWDGITLCQNFCGTPVYVPVEIYKRKPFNPLAADMWSFGICLYIVLNGTIPFTGSSIKQIINKQLNNRWRFRRKIQKSTSKEIQLVVARLLDPDPKTRMKSDEFIECQWFSSN